MCNLYTMTATVDELRRFFGPFDGDATNLPPFDEIYPGRPAPVLRRGEAGGLTLEMMSGAFPDRWRRDRRPVTNVRNLASPFWRTALNDPERRCIVPATRFCEWTAEPDPETKRKAKVWFGMRDEARPPLFAFAGLWRPGERWAVHGVPDLRGERDGRGGASQGDAGDASRRRCRRAGSTASEQTPASLRSRSAMTTCDGSSYPAEQNRTGRDPDGKSENDQEGRPQGEESGQAEEQRKAASKTAKIRAKASDAGHKGYDALVKLADHPLVADLLAVGATAAVAAIAGDKGDSSARQGGRQARRSRTPARPPRPRSASG